MYVVTTVLPPPIYTLYIFEFEYIFLNILSIVDDNYTKFSSPLILSMVTYYANYIIMALYSIVFHCILLYSKCVRSKQNENVIVNWHHEYRLKKNNDNQITQINF